MFHNWDKWIKHRFMKVCTTTFQIFFRYTWIVCTWRYAIANTLYVCLCVVGEVALQEGDSIFSQSQSLAAAVQQPRAPRCQPWEI